MRKKSLKNESDVKKKLIKPVLEEYLQAWFFMPVPRGMGANGIPDFIAAIPVTITPGMVGKRVAIFAAIEAKAPGKRGNVTALQERQIKGMRDAGGLAEVVSCKEDMLEFLDRLKNVLRAQ